MADLRFDEIGVWSELKLAILREYAKQYSTILANQQQNNLKHIYIDAFAGAGEHVCERTGEIVAGSPLNALAVEPPFFEYHLIDLNPARVGHLKELTASRNNVVVHEGNCNRVLPDNVFPRVRYEDYRRALCILDPYGLTLDWEVIATAGKLRTIDIFLNFPVMDMNRNVLWGDPKGVDPADVARMNAFWGDDSWQRAAYSEQLTLGGGFDRVKKHGNTAIVAAFRKRLQDVAGFKYVPEPAPMRNATGAVLYYLFFGSHKEAGQKIAKHLFKKYAEPGAAKRGMDGR